MWAAAGDDAGIPAAPLLDRLRNEVLPLLNAGPSQVIHNDAHSHNLLRPDAVSQEVVGLIDFGDMVYAPVINDLAVTAASFQRCGREDMHAVKNLLIGFHRTHPLSDAEVSLLWDAITLRVLLAILLCGVKLNEGGDPDPDVIEERDESRSMLEFIRSVDHGYAVNELRKACGYG
jgi:Ser/Thr protein kinase RdoA (MazF antagonist)